MDMTSLLFGVILGGMGIMVFALAIGLLWLMARMEYKYYIRIRNFTGGKAVCEYFWAKKIRHKELGEVYCIPKLAKEKRQYLPYLGSVYELPYKNKKYTVHMTWYNGEYTPEDFEDLVTEEKEIINPDTNQKETLRITRFIIRPVSKLMRQFIINNDRVVEQETELDPTWWDKNKWIVFGLIMAIIFAGVCITMFVYSYQYSIEMMTKSGNPPAWVANLLANATTNMAPPV